MMPTTSRWNVPLCALVASSGLVGCTSTGTWTVNIYGEAFIEEGIPASAFADEWTVSFERFDVMLSDVRVTDSEAVLGELDVAQTYDLTAVTDGVGQPVGEAEVATDTALEVDYIIADEGDDCALHVVGAAEKAAETLTFDWCIPSETAYVRCETDAVVTADAPGESQLTIHADHLFYDDLVSSEPDLRFDLIAAADTDSDGIVSEAELAATDITGEARYQVGNAEVSDLWAFIQAQSKTVGHIDGEGHCDTLY